MYFLGTILASIIAYFIGSISWSIIVVRWRRGIDIRNTGSGNAGATNTVRLLGPWWGFFVAFLDAIKVVTAAMIAVLFSLIPHELFSQTSYFIPALFVLIGHCWPIFYKFKGGKAVACFIGLLFVTNIWYLLIFLLVWWLSAAITRKVSISSIIAAVFVGLVIWIPWINGLETFAWRWNEYDTWMTAWSNPWLRFAWLNYLHVPTGKISGYQFADGMLEMIIVNFIGGMLLIYRHWGNIIRIKNKKEPQTFPKLTVEEKKELKKLRSQRKPTYAERKELKRLEKISRLEKQAKEINKKVANLRKEETNKKI